MHIVESSNKLVIENNGIEFIKHSEDRPFVFVGVGKETVRQHYGDFKIKDKVIEKIPLKYHSIEGSKIVFNNAGYYLKMEVCLEDNKLTIKNIETEQRVNRIYFNFNSDDKERIYGCGEQFSYLNLKGRNFPIWTSEPGVGKDPSSIITFQAEKMGIGGGDYFTTNYPQPTFISSKKYFCHVETTLYSDFDFSEDENIQITIWGKPLSITFTVADNFVDLLDIIRKRFGTQPKLPDWMLDGITLGIQGGTDVLKDKIKVAESYGIRVNAVWCQDWVGKKITSFGKRLFWKWEKDENTYPHFEKLISDLAKKNIKFMAYINPYLLEGTSLFEHAKERGYFVKRADGNDYIADFGEFMCGTIDFTYDEAFDWYKSIIKNNIIGLGISGWMADFGEYIPVDAVFKNGKTGLEMHNAYPVLWAKCNYEAVEESGKLGEIVYFMRAGGIGSQKYCTLMWAGDQSVDFSLHDGLASTIPASLSLGLLGNGLTHFDIGAYTSLFGNKRTEELMLRYLEYAVFTPYMRTHEGNRPNENFQYDSSEHCLKEFARASQLRHELMPYIKHVIEENSSGGLPAIRPIFIHYDDEIALDISYEYLFGRDLLVAPVYSEGAENWKLYLPEDEWVHLFTKKEYGQGYVSVPAPLGRIPVFYRKSSNFKELFDQIKF